MSNLSLFLLCFFSLDLIPNLVFSITSSSVQDPEHVVEEVRRSINASRTYLRTLSCGTGNPIDDCWRCDPNWEKNRKRLADCAIGFGKKATGGKDGRIYVVTKSGYDDPVNPKPGTLRHAVIQEEPLWIIFERDMVIKLKQHLVMNSYKTIDGRGANVHIADGPCIIIREATNIIIHGIHIYGCKQGGNGLIRVSPGHPKRFGKQDGDGIAIFGGQKIWIDHCSLSNCHDGLIDAVNGSTDITVSNNYMTHHNKVMLLGHSDLHDDKDMKVTVAFNHFGEGLVQRMPRCRHGYIHVVNNDYIQWGKYAIGGSASPTIYSQGNRFFAPNETYRKEVTRRMHDVPESEWSKWNWKSEGDLMLNGAYFRQSGAAESSIYAKVSSLSARSSSLVGSITKSAGALNCKKNSASC